MKTIELPCSIGDTIYYITAWNKYALQPKHKEKITKIEIVEHEIIFYTNYGKFLLSKYKKTWFTNKADYDKESKIVLEVFIKEQELRKQLDS